MQLLCAKGIKLINQNKVRISHDRSLKQQLLVQLHHTEYKLATPSASLKAFATSPLHTSVVQPFLAMRNENNCGCVCSLQYFHGCSTAPFWHKKSITYAANILPSWQLKSSSTLQTLSSALSGSPVFISKIYYLPDKLKWDSTSFIEAQSQSAIPCSLKWVSTHLSQDSIYLELVFACASQCNM